MAIVFHCHKYHYIKIDSHMIIGITGNNYNKFLTELTGENIFYIGNDYLNNKQTVLEFIGNVSKKRISEYLADLGLNDSFLNKYVNDLSHSEQKLLKYLQMLIADTSVVIVDEPFIDLDYDAKKRIIIIFKRLVKKKTIIIGSFDTDVIYSLCKKVLLIGKNKYTYDDVIVLSNKKILKQYNISMPEIIKFIRLAKDKGIKLSYSKDIRDLIKDVYKHVSK